jgi:hypothetical protein
VKKATATNKGIRLFKIKKIKDNKYTKNPEKSFILAEIIKANSIKPIPKKINTEINNTNFIKIRKIFEFKFIFLMY